jgi:hypothetical protein
MRGLARAFLRNESSNVAVSHATDIEFTTYNNLKQRLIVSFEKVEAFVSLPVFFDAARYLFQRLYPGTWVVNRRNKFKITPNTGMRGAKIAASREDALFPYSNC